MRPTCPPRRLAAVALCLTAAATACTGDGDGEIDITYSACQATMLAVGANLRPAQRDGVFFATLLWRDFGAPSLFIVDLADAPGQEAGPLVIELRFEKAAPMIFGLYDDAAGVVYINDGIEDSSVLSIVIAHELGHAFGLHHVTDRPSVMNPGNLGIQPTPADREALRALWGPC